MAGWPCKLCKPQMKGGPVGSPTNDLYSLGGAPSALGTGDSTEWWPAKFLHFYLSPKWVVPHPSRVFCGLGGKLSHLFRQLANPLNASTLAATPGHDLESWEATRPR